MLRRLTALAVLVLLAAPAWAAGTVVTTEKVRGVSVKKVTFAWTSSASTGAADATTTAAFDGEIVGLATDPGATAPSDDYDVVITDADGHDVLLGAGMNRDTANTEYVTGASLAAVSGSKLTLAITNAGNSKIGVVVIWIR